MTTTSTRTLGVLAGAMLLSGLTGTAGAQSFRSIDLTYGGQAQTQARLGQNQAFDERSFQDQLRFVSDDGVPGIPVFSSRDIGTRSIITQTFGEVSGSTEASLDSTLGRFALDADFDSRVFTGQGENSGDAEASLFFDGSMRVETDSPAQVEFTLRLFLGDIAGGSTDLDASIMVQGLDHNQMPMVELQNPVEGGATVLTLTTDLPATNRATIRFNAQVNVNGFADEPGSVSDFRLEATARVIPTPGALAPLAGLGLLATRRRR